MSRKLSCMIQLFLFMIEKVTGVTSCFAQLYVIMELKNGCCHVSAVALVHPLLPDFLLIDFCRVRMVTPVHLALPDPVEHL